MPASPARSGSAVLPEGRVQGQRYLHEIQDMLRGLLTSVVGVRQAEVRHVLEDEPTGLENRPELMVPALQTIGIWLQLLRIAEENTAMRVRRNIESAAGPDNVTGSFSNVVSDAARLNVPSEEVADVIGRLQAGPTLTAHPTESRRVTVMEIHRRIYRRLFDLEDMRWTPREREDLTLRLRNEIELLWLTGELRLEQPSLKQEITWGLHFFREVLFDAAPVVYRQLGNALRRHYTDHPFQVQPCLSFSSWIGGDRDGNPGVTADVTRQALKMTREAVLKRYLDALDDLIMRLSITETSAPIPQDFIARVRAASGPEADLGSRNPGEWFRQYLVIIKNRILATLGRVDATAAPYQLASDFIADLRAIEVALVKLDAALIAVTLVRPLRWQAETFGFRTSALDIRQNSTVINRVVVNILARNEIVLEAESKAFGTQLRADLQAQASCYYKLDKLDDEAQETVALFKLIAETLNGADSKAIGSFILSMTQSGNDLLACYWLAKLCGCINCTDSAGPVEIPIVPLFETIDDLRNATGILKELAAVPLVKRSIRAQGGHMEVMLGYSDSNKDGGFLCSVWEVSNAQKRIVETAKKLGFAVHFFHGRGGSVSRGGAPTGRAIATQPAGTVDGALRITEQGEVVSTKYSNKGTGLYQLELLSASVLAHTLKSPRENDIENAHFDEALQALSSLSQVAYTGLLNQENFIDYFSAASPVDELALLKIGSRPARRFGAKSLDDLRAIPWVFAWSQNRHLISGWYGLGSAIDAFLKVRGDEGKEFLHGMYHGSRLFRLAVDEVEKTLYQTDMDIAARYAGLVENTELRERIFGLVSEEFERTKGHILAITGEDNLAERLPAFKQRVDYVRPLLNRSNRWQVELLLRFRDPNLAEDDRETIRQALLLSMNCIASGLGWTG